VSNPGFEPATFRSLAQRAYQLRKPGPVLQILKKKRRRRRRKKHTKTAAKSRFCLADCLIKIQIQTSSHNQHYF
jgi:hypothetical protein